MKFQDIATTMLTSGTSHHKKVMQSSSKKRWNSKHHSTTRNLYLTVNRNFIEIDQERYRIRVEIISATDLSNCKTVVGPPVYAVAIVERRLSSSNDSLPERLKLSSNLSHNGCNPKWYSFLQNLCTIFFMNKFI